MKRLNQFLNVFRYAGLTDSEIKMCAPEINKRNAHALNRILTLIACVLVLLFVVALIPGAGEENNRWLYLNFAILLIGEHMFYRAFCDSHPQWILAMCYFFMLTVYVFGIIQCNFLGEESSSAACCVLLVAVPLYFIDTPLRLFIMIIGVEIVNLICYWLVGHDGGDPFVVINSVSSLVLGICYCYYIQQMKFRDIRNQLILKQQRDTDLMTGAGNRTAYVDFMESFYEHDQSVGVIFADVNGLKRINDSLGHEAGDMLIRDAHDLLKKYFHDSKDSIYRIGGDEFVIISLGKDETTFRNLYQAIAGDMSNGGIVSCGCVWHSTLIDLEEAVRDAEQLMYIEKNEYYRTHPNQESRFY